MPPPRRDRYGKPLPMLAPAPRQDVRHSDQNTGMRRWVLQLLEEEYQDLFRRDVYADVTLTLRIKEGTLMPDVDVTVQRSHRYRSEE